MTTVTVMKRAIGKEEVKLHTDVYRRVSVQVKVRVTLGVYRRVGVLVRVRIWLGVYHRARVWVGRVRVRLHVSRRHRVQNSLTPLICRPFRATICALILIHLLSTRLLRKDRHLGFGLGSWVGSGLRN